MVSGRLFHKEGPMYDKVFCPVIVLRNPISSSHNKIVACTTIKLFTGIIPSLSHF